MQRQAWKPKSGGLAGKRIQRSLTEGQRLSLPSSDSDKKAEKSSSAKAQLNVDPISDKRQAFHRHLPNTLFGPAAKSSGRQEKGERDSGLVPGGDVAQFCRLSHPETTLFPMLMGSKQILEKNPSLQFSVTRLAPRARHLLLPPLQQTVLPTLPVSTREAWLWRGAYTGCFYSSLILSYYPLFL